MEGKIPWDGIEKIGERGESSEELGRRRKEEPGDIREIKIHVYGIRQTANVS